MIWIFFFVFLDYLKIALVQRLSINKFEKIRWGDITLLYMIRTASLKKIVFSAIDSNAHVHAKHKYTTFI